MQSAESCTRRQHISCIHYANELVCRSTEMTSRINGRICCDSATCQHRPYAADSRSRSRNHMGRWEVVVWTKTVEIVDASEFRRE